MNIQVCNLHAVFATLYQTQTFSPGLPLQVYEDPVDQLGVTVKPNEAYLTFAVALNP